MKNVTMIAAIGKNNELGKNNDLIWRFKEDLNFFKEQTMGKPMAMGYKTFYSLRGGKPLPGRKHIVLTSRNLEENPQIKIVRSLEELIDYIKEFGNEVMIIGGASIYKSMIDYADKLVLTEIDAEDKEADAYFPKFNKDEWNSEELSSHEENNIKYKHLVYTRK